MTAALAFWATALLVATLALPIAFALFRRFPDGGAGLSLPLGLVLAGWGYFILRTLSILPQGRGGYLLALALFAAVTVAVTLRDRRFAATLRRVAPALLVVAGLFTVLFFGYVAVRSYSPEISGTEQPMDLMYLNATLTSPDYPPHDPWLAGERASYYYFGYLQVGLLTAVSGVEASEGYNLGLASTFAAAGTAVASIAFAFVRWAAGSRSRRWAAAAAGLAVGMLLLVGSLVGVFEYFAAHEQYNDTVYETFGVDWLLPCAQGETSTPEHQCYDGPVTPRTDHWYPTQFFWWFGDTRLIPGTIAETPFFSFLLGDLHPHVMSIPLVLLVLGLASAAYRGRRPLTWRTHLRSPFAGLALALVIGALAFTNAWDILTFTAVFAVAVLARNLRGVGERAPARPMLGVARAMAGAAGYLAPPVAVAIVAYLPWWLDFTSQAGGIYPYIGAGTRPPHAFLQFGALGLASLLAGAFAFRGRPPGLAVTAAADATWAPVLPILGWFVFVLARGELRDAVDTRTAAGWATLALYGAAVWWLTAAFLALARARGAAAVAVGFAAVGALLLLGAELFYIGDVFKGSLPRFNTVFKLGYQAWILLAVGGSVSLVLALREAARRGAGSGWLTLPACLVLLGGLATPVLAIANRTDAFGYDRAYDFESSIDGLSGLARLDPDEYALTRWVRANTAAGDVIIEASGRRWVRNPDGNLALATLGVDYTDAGRIAARTGRQAPIGWPGHEVQWRGDTPANQREYARRQDVVDRQVYLAPDAATALAAMRSFGARYVVVGALERTLFPRDALARFDEFLDVAFSTGDLRVYRLRGEGPTR